jgi:hypothetical protein
MRERFKSLPPRARLRLNVRPGEQERDVDLVLKTWSKPYALRADLSGPQGFLPINCWRLAR